MKNRRIHNHIRCQNLIRLIIPAIITLLIIQVTVFPPFSQFLFPKIVSDITMLDEDFAAQNKYALVPLSGLRYTGYNKVVGNKEVGGYYYYLEDDTCYFVVITPDLLDSDVYPNTIDSITLCGACVTNDPGIDLITQAISSDLEWTPQDFSKMVAPVCIDGSGFHPRLTFAMILLLCLLFSICVANVLILIAGIIYPAIALATLHHNNYFLLPKSLKKAEAELSENVIYSGNNMYITDNYFINLSWNSTCVVPLDQIVWAYYHSVLNRNLMFKHTLTYTLRLVTDKKRTFSAPGKNKAQCIEVLDVISNIYPEVLIGYSDENHLDFLYQIKSFFSRKDDD